MSSNITLILIVIESTSVKASMVKFELEILLVVFRINELKYWFRSLNIVNTCSILFVTNR